MNWFDKVSAWLNEHPYVKGALTAAEGAASGAIVDVLANPAPFSKAGLKQSVITVSGAVIIALRNYFREAPRKQWTAAERAEKVGGTDETNTKANSAAAGNTPTV